MIETSAPKGDLCIPGVTDLWFPRDVIARPSISMN